MFFISVSDVPSSTEVMIHQTQLISFIHTLSKHFQAKEQEQRDNDGPWDATVHISTQQLQILTSETEVKQMEELCIYISYRTYISFKTQRLNWETLFMGFFSKKVLFHLLIPPYCIIYLPVYKVLIFVFFKHISINVQNVMKS